MLLTPAGRQAVTTPRPRGAGAGERVRSDAHLALIGRLAMATALVTACGQPAIPPGFATPICDSLRMIVDTHDERLAARAALAAGDTTSAETILNNLEAQLLSGTGLAMNARPWAPGKVFAQALSSAGRAYVEAMLEAQRRDAAGAIDALGSGDAHLQAAFDELPAMREAGMGC